VTLTPEDLLLLQTKARTLLSLICFLWGIHALNWAVFRGGLNWVFGIRPREMLGLIGIVTSPFLHLEEHHLPGNTLALLPLGGFVLLQGLETFYVVSIMAGLADGLGTWLFGRQTHYPYAYVGFSGVIFGYLGFLLIYGLVAGNLLALLVALIVGFQYGKLITGSSERPSDILPGSPSAWISHLFGFIGGIVAAYSLGFQLSA
jgi:membrane associated rhomboid family serine protease